MIVNHGRDGRYALAGQRRAFTLIVLLTVVAIISLLMAILLPSLSGARDAAKNAKCKATMKSLGDGLELFRNENEAELHGNNYPSSTPGDDPTVAGDLSAPATEELFGAQWLVRYLMGKDLNGYIPRRNVSAGVLKLDALKGDEQIGQDGKSWYEQEDAPPNRDPLYVAMDARMVKRPNQLQGFPPKGGDRAPASAAYINPVFVDVWEMPILYYAADTKAGYTEKANANITSFDRTEYRGIYTFVDNALFTGLCTADFCSGAYPQWLFKGLDHKLVYPSNISASTTPAKWAEEMAKAENHDTFSYTIMNKEAFESTGGGSSGSGTVKGSVIPVRKDSFLLLSPGKDGQFGTGDDIWNFK
jgi:type II secretory pathway pseudopilin PulG